VDAALDPLGDRPGFRERAARSPDREERLVTLNGSTSG